MEYSAWNPANSKVPRDPGSVNEKAFQNKDIQKIRAATAAPGAYVPGRGIAGTAMGAASPPKSTRFTIVVFDTDFNTGPVAFTFADDIQAFAITALFHLHGKIDGSLQAACPVA